MHPVAAEIIFSHSEVLLKNKSFHSITKTLLFTCLYEIRNVQFHWCVFKVLVAAGREKSTIAFELTYFP